VVRRYDVNEYMSLKAQMNLAAEQGMSHGMLDVDFKVCVGHFSSPSQRTCAIRALVWGSMVLVVRPCFTRQQRTGGFQCAQALPPTTAYVTCKASA